MARDLIALAVFEADVSAKQGDKRNTRVPLGG